jgi:hypothetical protein
VVCFILLMIFLITMNQNRFLLNYLFFRANVCRGDRKTFNYLKPHPLFMDKIPDNFDQFPEL